MSDLYAIYTAAVDSEDFCCRCLLSWHSFCLDRSFIDSIVLLAGHHDTPEKAAEQAVANEETTSGSKTKEEEDKGSFIERPSTKGTFKATIA